MRNHQTMLIADAGGTSTRWCLVGKDGYLVRDLYAAPINVCINSDSELSSALQPVETLIKSAEVIYFYGAGCREGSDIERLTASFRKIDYNGELNIASDLLGAARATLGNKPGIACILGTGSNSCYYDGTKIVKNIAPLGYILGDEGSGVAIGKRFLRELLRGELSEGVTKNFFSTLELSISDIYENIYRKSGANKFLSSFSRYIIDNIDNREIRKIVENEFNDFYSHIICKYPNAKEYPLSFVGSVAYFFSDILRATASRHGFNVMLIEREPIMKLIEYHRAN